MATLSKLLRGVSYPLMPAADIRGPATGLVAVDVVNGFCKPGAGNLAPPAPDAAIERMIENVARELHRAHERNQQILVLRDRHQPGKPERPFATHCEAGSGEEELVEQLAWLTGLSGVVDLPKDCFNGVIGGINLRTGQNAVINWVNRHRLKRLAVMGICTDICVLQFVQAMLSVRNHGLTPTLEDVIVYEPGCATYDLPLETARKLKLPESAAHPREPFHHIGLTLMAQSGAVITEALE